MRRVVLATLSLVWFACTPTEEEPARAEMTGQSTRPIYGVYEAAGDDDASDLTTSSIAGTVVRLDSDDSSAAAS